MNYRSPSVDVPQPAAEVVPVTANARDGSTRTAVVVSPTQVRRPWRSTARTVFQAFIGLCVLAPLIVGATGLTVAQLPWLGVVLGVAAAVTRIMAIPGVEAWLRRFLPFLAAAPKQ
ncbi:hypothetical protein [Nocardioides sp. 503]|uniref:hypothetical protein n=1 Tax=Nocardioides sp. 503 TaxID=2508326 RepID=UPI001ADAED6C|nr:hypothetical protein [Nocardioides sp. 503]